MMGTAGTQNMKRSSNKTKTLLLHLVGYSYTYLEYDAQNHESKIYNEINTMILFSKKNEDKIKGNHWGQCSIKCENILCKSTSSLPQKMKWTLYVWLEDEAQKGSSVCDAVVTEGAKQLNNHCEMS
jgi:hypothetical protein